MSKIFTDAGWTAVRGAFLEREIVRLADAEPGSLNFALRGMSQSELTMLRQRQPED